MSGGRNASGYPDPTAATAIRNVDRERRRKEMQMKRKTEGKQYRTTRAQYKDVKRYDHPQLDDFCTIVYREGFKDGEASAPGIEVEEALGIIRGIKGIGEKRLAEIEARLNARYAEKRAAR